MVSGRAREQMTFARTLETALREMGHRVYRGPDEPDAPDLVLAGVTSALSPASSYALIGLEQIGWALKKKVPLLLFVDDPQLGKTRAAAQSAQRDPDRLWAPYLVSKRVKMSTTVTKPARDLIGVAVDVLAGDYWPPVLVPLHPWADPAIAAKRLGVVSDIVPVDVSSAVELPSTQAMDREKAPLWLTDRHYSPYLLEQERVTWPVVPIDSTLILSPAHVYSVARGIHQGATDRMPGWWTPTPTYVARANTVYLCDSEESQAIGADTPYYLTPDQVESTDDEGHSYLAWAQADYLKEISWDQATLSSHLADSIGRVASSAKRATKKARPRT
jgi:hypothetical protein